MMLAPLDMGYDPNTGVVISNDPIYDGSGGGGGDAPPEWLYPPVVPPPMIQPTPPVTPVVPITTGTPAVPVVPTVTTQPAPVVSPRYAAPSSAPVVSSSFDLSSPVVLGGLALLAVVVLFRKR